MARLKTIATPPIQRVALLQLALLLPIALLLMIVDVATGFSALLGGLVQIGPQAWFNRFAFRFVGARQALQVTRAIYYGETGKFILTVALFAVIFIYVKPQQPLVLFLFYALMVLVHWIGSVKLLKQHDK